MTTIAPPLLLNLARRIESAIPSAVFSGIVPNASHGYGFHLSGEDLGWNRGDYSLASDDNYSGAQQHPQWAAAFDMSMSPSDLTTVHSRVRASWADPNDSRMSLWYESIGAINGTVSRLVSYEPDYGEFFDADITHTWHEHTSARRSQLGNVVAMDALYGVWIGRETDKMNKDDVLTFERYYDDGLDNKIEYHSVEQTMSMTFQAAYAASSRAGAARAGIAALQNDIKALTAAINNLSTNMVTGPSAAEVAGELIKQMRP